MALRIRRSVAEALQSYRESRSGEVPPSLCSRRRQDGGGYRWNATPGACSPVPSLGVPAYFSTGECPADLGATEGLEPTLVLRSEMAIVSPPLFVLLE
jgi:hypothetical protein